MFIRALLQEKRSIFPSAANIDLGTTENSCPDGFLNINRWSALANSHHSCKQVPVFLQLHEVVVFPKFACFSFCLPSEKLLFLHWGPDSGFSSLDALFDKTLRSFCPMVLCSQRSLLTFSGTDHNLHYKIKYIATILINRIGEVLHCGQ